MEEWIKAIFALIGIIALILAFYYFGRRFTSKSAFTGNSALRILERIPLGQDKALALVRVCDRLLLIGITNGGITNLCELSGEDISAYDAMKAQGNAAGFMAQLKSAMAARGAQRGAQQDSEGGGADDQA